MLFRFRSQVSTPSQLQDQILRYCPGFTVSGWGLNGEDIEVMRIVVREEMTAEMMAKILQHLVDAVKALTGKSLELFKTPGNSSGIQWDSISLKPRQIFKIILSVKS
jgi:hypothetical protein